MRTNFGEKFYETDEYLGTNPTWHAEDSPWKARQILKIIQKNDLQPDSICEIGCGAGEILNQLFLQMRDNVSFVGYEISPYAFKLCEQKAKNRLDYKLENLFEDTSAYYDIVMAIDVFEHVEDYFGFLRNLREKGKYKIFHIPLDMSVQNVLRNSTMLKSREEVGHIHYFSKDTALAALRETGYDIIDYFYTPSVIELSTKSFKSFLMKLPRRVGFKINKDWAVRILGGYSLMVLTK